MLQAADGNCAEFSSKRRSVVTDSLKAYKQCLESRRESDLARDELKLPLYQPDQIGNGGSKDEKSNKKILEFDHREKMRCLGVEDRKIGHGSHFTVGENE
jgi:hypothetical protein